MTTDNPVVLVQPTDSVAAIAERVQQTGAERVQLLVQDDVTLLQNIVAMAELRLLLKGRQITVISGDDKTLHAARRVQFEPLRINGAQVTMAATPAASAETARLDDLATPETAPAASAETATPQPAPVEEVPSEAAPTVRDEPIEGASPADETPAPEDAVSDIVAPPEPTQPAAEAAPAPAETPEAATLDALDNMEGDDQTGAVSEDTAPYETVGDDGWLAAPANIEYSANDEPLPDEDWNMPVDPPLPRRPRGRTEEIARIPPGERETRSTMPIRRSAPTPQQARVTSRTAYPAPLAQGERAPRRTSLVLPIVIVLLIFAAVVAGGWYYSNQVVVYVAPPPGASTAHEFKNEVIPLAAKPPAETGTVLAEPVGATVEITADGQAGQQRVPVGVARGKVTIINRLGQPIDLPQGTEFVATNAQGQEVRFLSDGAATVPPAVTTSTLTGSNTTFGQVDVAVSAKSPGSQANVDANTVTQIVPPGAAPIQNSGNISIVNEPITGGTEEDVYVVTQDDVAKVLPDALSKLYDHAREELAARSGDLVLDPTTITPGPGTLGDATNHEIVSVTPNVGDRIPNDASPVFSVKVRGQFSALATPKGEPVNDQLTKATFAHLATNGVSPCANDETPSFGDTSYQWDGQRLTVTGSYTCTPRGSLPRETLVRVRNAIRGQSREAAEASLQQLRAQGVIGNFTLPDKATLPKYDFLIDVQENLLTPTAVPTGTTPGQAAPTPPAEATPGATSAPEATP